MKIWHKYGSLHTEDSYSESHDHMPHERQPIMNGQRNLVVGPVASAAVISKFIEDPVPMVSVHHAHPPETDINSSTTASAIWPTEDHPWWHIGDREEFLHGNRNYYERYRKIDDKGLICWRKLVRLRVDKSPGFHDH